MHVYTCVCVCMGVYACVRVCIHVYTDTVYMEILATSQ